MQVELLKEIVSEVAGQGSVEIVDLLYNKKNVNEFNIAKKLDLTINQTRNILYKLGDEGLVSFIRKKDAKKGGWYIYFWTLNVHKSLLKLKERVKKEIKRLMEKIETKEKKSFYYCENCEIEYSEDYALLHDYSCPECGELLNLKESGKEIEGMSQELKKQKGILSSLDEELAVVSEKEEKARQRKFKAEKKKKDEERLKRKKERDKLKKKLLKGKKPVKKKAKKKKPKKKAKKKKAKKKKPKKKAKKKKVAKKKVKKKAVKKKVAKKKKFVKKKSSFLKKVFGKKKKAKKR